MKDNCYQDCSVIHGWFVYCAFCWQMHRLSKSWEVRFRMASFSKMSACPCLRRKRVEKSQAILEHLMTDLQKQHLSTGKPEKLLSLMCCFFFGLLKSSVWFIHEQWSNLQYSIRFKNPLDVFWPQIQRKGSEEYLVMILAVNRKLWAIFLPRVHLEKEQTPGSRLKT